MKTLKSFIKDNLKTSKLSKTIKKKKNIYQKM